MTTPDLQDVLNGMSSVAAIIAGFVVFVGAIAAGVLIKRYSVFQFQDEAIKNLNDAYNGLEKRFGEEVACRKQLETRVQEQPC